MRVCVCVRVFVHRKSVTTRTCVPSAKKKYYYNIYIYIYIYILNTHRKSVTTRTCVPSAGRLSGSWLWYVPLTYIRRKRDQLRRKRDLLETYRRSTTDVDLYLVVCQVCPSPAHIHSHPPTTSLPPSNSLPPLPRPCNAFATTLPPSLPPSLPLPSRLCTPCHYSHSSLY